MTINAQIPINRHIASGSNTDFPFTFYIRANDNLVVNLNSVKQTEGADYNLINVTPAGGTVRFLAPPFLNSAIVIYRETPVSQETDYDPYDPFPAETHEAALDKLTLIAQENRVLGITSLPLNVSGLFWDALGLRIQNGADPINRFDYATKNYVDSRGGGGGGGFDPDADYTTTGNWTNEGVWSNLGNWTFAGAVNFLGSATRNGVQIATVADIPNVSQKADKSTRILSADANQIIIDNPTLADDVTIRTRTNAPNGLTKLDAEGKVPASLLPFTGLEFLGSYNPSLGTPAPGTPGQFYVFSADGTITLLDEDGNPVSYTVKAGDWMLFSDTPVAGWYYIERTAGNVPAVSVSYDNTLIAAARQLSATDVQGAIDEVATEFASRVNPETVSSQWNFSGGRPTHQSVNLATVAEIPNVSNFPQKDQIETITGAWEFAAAPLIVGSRWPAGVGTGGQVLTTNGSGQLSWDDPAGAGGMDPTQDYTISGDWTFVGVTAFLPADGQVQLAGPTNSRFIIGDAANTGEMRVSLVNNLKSIDFTIGAAVANYGFFDRTLSQWALELRDTSANFGARVVSAGAGTSPGNLVRRDQITDSAWTVSGNWTFSAALILNSSAYMANQQFYYGRETDGTLRTIAGVVGNEIRYGASTNPMVLASNGILSYNGAALNQPNGLVKVQANGKIPFDLTAFSALAFIGTWDASGGTNPPNGTEGGQFYVIIKGGDLLVFVDDSGTPVLTTVSPGDYLLWLGAGSGLTPGWYYIATEAPTLVDSNNVFYDPSGAAWTQTLVQAVLDEISTRATLRDRVETISAAWTFSVPVTGVAATQPTHFPILSQADGRYGRKASAETISAVWNFTAQPTINGVNIATVNDIPSLTAYAQKAANESITGTWSFTQPLTFSVGRYSVLQQFQEATDGAVFEHTTRANGSARVLPRTGTTLKKVGFRNPTISRTMITPITLSQDDEGQIIRIDSTGAAITVPSLEAGTQITLIQRAAAGGSTPLTLSGVTAVVLDGGSGYAATGAITVDAGGVVHLAWETTTTVNIWGSGLKRA